MHAIPYDAEPLSEKKWLPYHYYMTSLRNFTWSSIIEEGTDNQIRRSLPITGIPLLVRNYQVVRIKI